MTTLMDIEAIKKYIPHRYPFLLIDRVEELVLGSHIVAYKNVTINEYFFEGHFPGMAVMPGVLTLETMAQACGILSASAEPDEEVLRNLAYLLTAADHVRYKRPIFPGDVMRIEMKIVKVRNGMSKYKGEASVEGQVACEATIFCKGVDKREFQLKRQELK